MKNSSLLAFNETLDSPALRLQKTIKSLCTVNGIGVHTGRKATLRIHPAPEGFGIQFRRIDLSSAPLVKACVLNARGCPRHSQIALGDSIIYTPEHLLAALKGLEIDNACIEIDGPEIPIMDGSAKPFVDLFEKTGTIEQEAEVFIHNLDKPIHLSFGDTDLVALPYDGFRLSVTLDFPHKAHFPTQFYSYEYSQESFIELISASRTFCFYEDVAALLEQNLIKGGSLDCAVVFRDGQVMSSEGLRYQDEPVRHKILDLIGDLSLLRCHLNAHIIAIRPGHQANVPFARKLHDHLFGEKQ